tara:strand:+ start:6052 stop:6789 length:738 start_codon:yes stop_codon:yes gene_type:complete
MIATIFKTLHTKTTHFIEAIRLRIGLRRSDFYDPMKWLIGLIFAGSYYFNIPIGLLSVQSWCMIFLFMKGTYEMLRSFGYTHSEVNELTRSALIKAVAAAPLIILATWHTKWYANFTTIESSLNFVVNVCLAKSIFFGMVSGILRDDISSMPESQNNLQTNHAVPTQPSQHMRESEQRLPRMMTINDINRLRKEEENMTLRPRLGRFFSANRSQDKNNPPTPDRFPGPARTLGARPRSYTSDSGS